MKLEGVHHVTAITGDAPGNVDFYARVLGLRLVKKSVNQDDPTVYHLFYGDEEGAPGNDITFFEYPGARPGRAGAGMVHRVVWRVGSDDALAFWERAPRQAKAFRPSAARRLAPVRRPRGSRARAGGRRQAADEPLIADHPGDPGRAGAPGLRRACAPTRRPGGEPRLPRGHARVRASAASRLGGARRAARRLLPLRRHADERGVPGAGTVHHVAWASPTDEHEAWQRARRRGRRAPPRP